MGILSSLSRGTRAMVAIAATLGAMVAFGRDSDRVAAASPPLLVIVGSSFPAADISLATLKDAFRGTAASVSGRQLIPINHAVGSHERVLFDRAVLGLEPAAVGRFWVDVRIRDEGKPPTTASSAELAVRIVAAIPNAISYTTATGVNPKVKVLSVAGKSATQPDYVLGRYGGVHAR